VHRRHERGPVVGALVQHLLDRVAIAEPDRGARRVAEIGPRVAVGDQAVDGRVPRAVEEVGDVLTARAVVADDLDAAATEVSDAAVRGIGASPAAASTPRLTATTRSSLS
jgi:hypothetical protein